MPWVKLETSRITDWNSFHAESKKALGFPEFYGANMDAWIDCLSYLREGDGMSRFVLAGDELLHIEVVDSESFHHRLPEIFEAMVECVSFVNRRYRESGDGPAISLVLI